MAAGGLCVRRSMRESGVECNRFRAVGYGDGLGCTIDCKNESCDIGSTSSPRATCLHEREVGRRLGRRRHILHKRLQCCKVHDLCIPDSSASWDVEWTTSLGRAKNTITRFQTKKVKADRGFGLRSQVPSF